MPAMGLAVRRQSHDFAAAPLAAGNPAYIRSRRRAARMAQAEFISAEHVKLLGGPRKVERLCGGAVPRPGAGDFCHQTKVTKSWLRTYGSKNSLFSGETWERMASGLEWALFAEVRHCRSNEPAPSAPLGAPAVPGRSPCSYRNSVEPLPSTGGYCGSRQRKRVLFPAAGCPLWGGKRTAKVTALGDTHPVLRQRIGDPRNVREGKS